MTSSNDVVQMNQKDIYDHFNLVKENTSIIRYRCFDSDVEFFFKKLDLDRILSSGMKVLELGCGGGNILRYLAKNFGIIPYGIDLKNFTRLYPTRGLEEIQINFEVGNIQERIPYDNETFDFVYSFMTFMRLTDKLKGLVECHRVMKVGSIAYIDIQGDRFHNDGEGLKPSFSEILEKYPNQDQIQEVRYWSINDSNCLAVKIEKIFKESLDFPPAESFLIEEDLKLTSIYTIITKL